MKIKVLCSLMLTLIMVSQVEARNDAERRGPPERPSFSSLDLDGDGSVTYEEFSSHEVPFGDHKTIFGHIDSDQDGSISQEEFEGHKPPKKKKGER